MNLPDGVKRYLDGFSTPDEMQEPPGLDGDPQLAALTQFLQSQFGVLLPEDVILDVGSGHGILAHALLRIWPPDGALPWYHAVDRQHVIDKLSLPAPVHNHSRKVPFDDFLSARPRCLPRSARVAVLRNVLHELDIPTTAKVLSALRKAVHPDGQIYIQDFVAIPKGEREKAGWAPDLLCDVLAAAGLDCGPANMQRSRSGTGWFTLIVTHRRGAPDADVRKIAGVVAEARQEQMRRGTTRLAELGVESNAETAPEFFQLSMEVAALGTQLQLNHYAAASSATPPHAVAGIPLLAVRTPLDYAEEVPASMRRGSGLRAVLASKNLIDLPALLDEATSRLWFAGYSQRLLFGSIEVRASLLQAARRGVDVRILLVDPTSPAAVARSLSDAYDTPDDLFTDILTTRRGFEAFDSELRGGNVAQAADIRCELRLCTNLLSSSFFFVDDVCICSLYSWNLTGGLGTAFVFQSSSVQPNGYFQVLLREFQSAWGRAAPDARHSGRG